MRCRLPPEPARRGKKKGKRGGGGGTLAWRKKKEGGDWGQRRPAPAAAAYVPPHQTNPVKISRRADDDDGARQAPHRTCVPTRRPPSAAGDGRMVQVGGRGSGAEGRTRTRLSFSSLSLSRATRMAGEWVVAAVSGTRSPPGRSLTPPPPPRPLERVVRGSCLRRPAVSAWRAGDV